MTELVAALGAASLVAVVAVVAIAAERRRHRELAARVVELTEALGRSAGSAGDLTGAADVEPLVDVATSSGPSSTPAPDHPAVADTAVAEPDEAFEAVVAEVTATVAHERSLRTRLAAALDAVPEALLIVDEHGTEVFRNPAAATYREARHGDALVEAALGELIEDATAGLGSERTLELFGPPRRTVAVRAVPLSSGTTLVGALALIEDMTERRRLEEVRRDFVANISHELKTPIGALSLLAETLLAEDDVEVANRLASRMVTEASRVARTIEDLLVLSRIETEEATQRELVEVGAAMAEAAGRIRPAAEQRGIVVEVAEPSRRLAVVAERRQLVSAIYNLLDNAVKYSDDDSEVRLLAETDGRSVGIVVEDDGVGIPARDIERVFERFYRVDHARSRQTGGTGLGLAIVRHVAANHDGDVRVESRLGEGSRFELLLPSASGPVAVTDEAEGRAQAS
ncbi:MAG: ATP-binding protein [Acidimicrobiia bacterium]|nr:ATP-binding protein [Acidimicrobiia bacterium]